MSARDISETAGGISAAGERHTFNRRTDSRQRGADIVAAIEKSRKARSRDDLPKPAGTDIAASPRRAGEHDRAGRPRAYLRITGFFARLQQTADQLTASIDRTASSATPSSRTSRFASSTRSTPYA